MGELPNHLDSKLRRLVLREYEEIYSNFDTTLTTILRRIGNDALEHFTTTIHAETSTAKRII